MNNLNLATTLALVMWPLVATILYGTQPIGRATLWTILGAYMLLPVGADIKIKMIPALDKNSIANFAALFACIVVGGRSIKLFNKLGLAEFLIFALLICPFITCELNGDPIAIGSYFLPGLDSYDAGSAVVAQIVTLIPFFLGRQILRNSSDTEEILRVLVIAGLVYSLPALVEVRLSPQLHTWIYGYFPTTGDGPAFSEVIRDGGFRPVIFMGHGLLVSFFFATSAVAAAAFWRTGTRLLRTVRLPAIGITAYLCFVLALCKTAGSAIYGAVLVPLVRFTPPKLQVNIAVLLVSVALLYPMLRTADLIPKNAALDLAGSISLDRRASLETRFINEDALLEHASQRFLFGWGRYGRGWVYNADGSLRSALDGIWIITLGSFGFIGFLAQFGLLAFPVFNAARALRFAESASNKVFLSALSLILAINIFDLLLNSSLRPWTWLIAGSLLGRAEMLRRHSRIPTVAQKALSSSSSEDQPQRLPSPVN